VQELGSVKQVGNNVELYVPGSHCMEALSDIVKACQNDNQKSQVTRVLLGKWNTLQQDLMPLFATQYEDKNMSFQLLI